MNPLPRQINGESFASFLSRVGKQKDPEKQALLDSLLEDLKSAIPKKCYRCDESDFKTKGEYLRHCITRHPGLPAYPGPADILAEKLPFLPEHAMGEMINMDLDEFYSEIKPSIKWSASTGFYRCAGCGAQLDSTSKLSHWSSNHCSLSKDKTVQKLRAQVIAENFPAEEKPAIKEAGLDWYQNQNKINESLPIDFNPTGAPINEDLYHSSLKELSSKDIQDLADLFSGKIKCRAKHRLTEEIKS